MKKRRHSDRLFVRYLGQLDPRRRALFLLRVARLLKQAGYRWTWADGESWRQALRRWDERRRRAVSSSSGPPPAASG